MTDELAGPWVLVVGMHRSGTSALTGALGAMGLNEVRSEDRVDWPESNPEHWESLSVSRYDEALLRKLGGSWDVPPDFPEGWEHSPEIRNTGDPLALVAEAFPAAGASVWKDPRLCLLLPYWREVLPPPIAAVLIWRSPLAVAHSLRRRDQLTIVEGVALWERYNRSAIEGLQGIDTFVLNYETLIEGPKRCLTALGTWLSSLEQFRDTTDRWDVDLATAGIASDLHHAPEARSENGPVVLQAEQLELVQLLTDLSGGHRAIRSELPSTESAWTATVLRARGMIRELNEELDSTKLALRIANNYLESTKAELDFANGRIAGLHASTSWKVTKPVRALTASLEKSRRHPPET